MLEDSELFVFLVSSAVFSFFTACDLWSLSKSWQTVKATDQSENDVKQSVLQIQPNMLSSTRWCWGPPWWRRTSSGADHGVLLKRLTSFVCVLFQSDKFGHISSVTVTTQLTAAWERCLQRRNWCWLFEETWRSIRWDFTSEVNKPCPEKRAAVLKFYIRTFDCQFLWNLGPICVCQQITEDLHNKKT